MPIDGLPIGEYGPWALVSTFVLLVFFGGLMPRWTHNRIVHIHEKMNNTLTKALEKRDEQFDTLMHQGEMTVKLLEDIKRSSMNREANL